MTSFGKIFSFSALLLIVGVVYFFVVAPVTESTDSLSEVVETDSGFEYNEESDLYIIQAKYPDAGNEKINADIELFVWGEIGEFKKYFTDIDEEDVREIESNGTRAHVLNISYDIKKSEDLGFVAYVFTVYQYGGGAHGFDDTVTLTYKTNGERIKIQNLLKKDSQNLVAVASITQDVILKSFPYEIDLFDSGIVPQFENFERFYIEDNHVVFIFPPYQILPYAMGTIEARVPLSEVFGYFREDILPMMYGEIKESAGHIISGAEVREFSYCESDTSFWYQDTTGVLLDEYRRAKISEDPYEKIPVILKGYTRSLASTTEIGFASEYDQVFVITDVTQVGGETCE